MKKIIILLASLVYCLSINAHSAKEAFFVFKMDSSLTVEAEFPWTIRKAVSKDYPLMQTAKSKQVVDSLFFEYTKTNFRVFDDAGIINPLLKIIELPNTRHSHSYKVLLVFKKQGFETIENSLMFNINNDQVNYHTLYLDENLTTYRTNNNDKTFRVSTNISAEFWGILVGFVVLMISFYLLIKKKKSISV